MAMSSTSTPQSASLGSFYQAHHFDIHNSTFVDASGSVRKLEELKVDLKNTVIYYATYDELSRRRRDQFIGYDIPERIEEWIKNPHSLFLNSRFLKTSNKDILSVTGIPMIRYFRNNDAPGIKLVAHILFYDIPIIEEGHIINSRQNVSYRWVTTIAYQLMINVPELAIPMLEALHMDPRIPKYNSEEQIRRLIVSPLRSVMEQGLLSDNETKLILLDCIDCSTDAPSMANDIAYLIEELALLEGQPLKLLVTGLPDYRVISTFSGVPIEISDLSTPRRVNYPQTRRVPPPRGIREKWNKLSVLKKKYISETVLGAGTLTAGGIISLAAASPVMLYVSAGLVGLGVAAEGLLTTSFWLTYSGLKYTRPWDVHGREEAVKKDILEMMEKMSAHFRDAAWGVRR